MSSNEWEKATLSEVCDIIGGGTPKTSVTEYWGGNIPWLSVVDFNNDNRHVFTTEKMITDQGLNNSSTKLLNLGDIIISARGTVGALAQLAVPMAFNQSCYGIRAKSVTLNDFLYYAIKNNINQIKANTYGSVFDTITRATFDNLKILLPSIKEQKAIVATISCLDEKIELNRKINDNLEQQVMALFNELFDLNKGVTVPISDVIDVRDGTHASPKPVEKGYPLITSKHLLPYSHDIQSANKISKEDYDKTNERSQVEQYDILLSMIGTVGLISFVMSDEINFAIKNVGLFKTSHADKLAYYILCFLKSDKVTSHIQTCLAGSTQRYISLGELRKIPLLVPNEVLLTKFNDTVKPIFDLIKINLNEIEQLKLIRDTLLPKLMSGEIDVSQVQI